MYPWLFLWAPQYHFPWSGAVNQDISPDTFFGAIPSAAGDGKIEQEIFNSVSYGKQLGALTEVVLSLLNKSVNTPATQEEQAAAEQLRSTAAKIKGVKTKHRKQSIDTAVKVLRELKQSDPAELQRIVADL